MNLTNIGEIRALLERHGFRFSKSMGQNFLTAAWVPERIAESAGLGPDVGVLEVGPGVGCLTEQLSLRAGRVLSVELDTALKGVLSETLAGRDNVEVVFGDILRQDIPALVTEKLPGLRRMACANLPYNITSPALTALIEAKCFSQITVMIQREVALRLCAAPGTADYGAFSVFVQWHTVPEKLFDVSPGCFIPQPKVTSSVVSLHPRSAPPAEVPSEALFFQVVRAAFAQRRKTLVNALAAGLSGYDKGEIAAAVADAGLDARVRGEALGIAEFAALTRRLAR